MIEPYKKDPAMNLYPLDGHTARNDITYSRIPGCAEPK